MKKTLSRTIVALSVLFMLSVICAPTTATSFFCGVSSGTITNYSCGQTDAPKITSWKNEVISVSGTLVTFNMTRYYDNGTIANRHQDTDNLTIQENVYGYSPWPLMPYIAKDLLPNDPVWYGSSVKINQTINNYVIAGASRTANYINITSKYGDWSLDSYYDKATGILLRCRYWMETISSGIWWANLTLTSTSLWGGTSGGIPWLYVGAAGVIIVGLAVAVAVLKKHK